MFELLTDCLKNADTLIWKHNRKAIHSFMSPSHLEAYLPKQQVEYVHFLHDILTQPQVSSILFCLGSVDGASHSIRQLLLYLLSPCFYRLHALSVEFI